MSARAAIIAEGLCKSFEHGRIRALDGVSLTVEAGELVALTGASGSGKSTLLNLIGALDRPDAGSLLVDGRDLMRLEDAAGYRAEVVGFVFQAHNLLPALTAMENVQLPMFGRLGRRSRMERAERLLGEVELASRAHARPTVLSGGERQRIAIARALANDPRVLLADEPTGSLDSATGGHVLDLIERVRRERGMTVLLVTNDETVAARADRILHLHDGVIRGAEPRSAGAARREEQARTRP